MRMTKRFGFTLAEVLITLGIIGVVAAMTIPNLIANTNGAKFRSQFKKTLSTLNQAGLMSQAQYDFDFGGATEACDNSQQENVAKENPEGKMSFCALLNGTLTGHTAVGPMSGLSVKNQTSGSGEDTKSYAESIADHGVHALVGTDIEAYVAYSLADGSIVAFSNAAKDDDKDCTLALGTTLNNTWLDNHSQCIGFIDVNGTTLPNKEVSCTDVSATNNSVQTPCAVKNDAKHMTDIFPIVFHDATVEPASNAAKYVLTTSK